jgi:hypothetical protein
MHVYITLSLSLPPSQSCITKMKQLFEEDNDICDVGVIVDLMKSELALNKRLTSDGEGDDKKEAVTHEDDDEPSDQVTESSKQTVEIEVNVSN